MHSQNILTKKPRVETLINSNKDTVIQFKINDARVILRDLLDKKYTDSLLVIDEDLNNVNENIIKLDGEHIKLLEEENKNNAVVINNLNENIKIKDDSIKIKDNSIKTLKNEVTKQKFLKYLACIGTIALGILLITK